MRFITITWLLACVALVSGCGTTSSLSEPGGAAMPDLSDYDTVVVLDFANSVDMFRLSGAAHEIKEREVRVAGERIADQLALEIEKNRVFANVRRSPVEGPGLQISGVITRLEEGNAALRMLVGFGAGSSYFDAEVYFVDNQTGEPLGEVIIDRNSWVMGGGIAAAQNAEFYIDEAARQITRDLMVAKGVAVPKQLTSSGSRGGSRR